MEQQLSKAQFTYYINKLQEEVDYQQELSLLNNKYNKKYYGIENGSLDMVDCIIQLLEAAFDDNALIFSWVFDKDFGRDKTSYENFPKEIKTTDDLYDYLCNLTSL